METTTSFVYDTVAFESTISTLDSANITNHGRSNVTFLAKQIEDGLVLYLLPIIVFVGTIGNVLSFIVLMKSRMRNTSVYFYLMVLACADTVVLYVSGFKTWIRLLTDFELLNVSDAWCKITFFLLLVSFHLAAWIVVLITLDRFIAVWLPLHAARMCTLRRAWIATASLVLAICIFNFHVFWTFRLRRRLPHMCTHVSEFKQFVKPFVILRLISYSILPFIIIFILNIAIIIRLRRTPQIMQQRGGPGGRHTSSVSYSSIERFHPSSSSLHYGNPRQMSFKETQTRLTYMLLTVSIAWLVLTAPSSMFALISQAESDDPRTKANTSLVKTICFLLYYTNHSINFFLYCITGKKFRKELIEIFNIFGSFGRGYSPSVRTMRSNCLEMEVVPAQDGVAYKKQTNNKFS